MKLLIVILLTCFHTGYTQSLHTIRGQIIGQNAGTVYLYSAGVFRQGTQLVDSVKLSSQFFSFQKVLSEPNGYYISLNNVPGQLYFVWDKDIVISLKIDNLNQSLVEESSVNEAIKSFSDTVETVYERRFKEIVQAFSQAKLEKDTLQTQQIYQHYLSLGIEYKNAISSHIKKRKEQWDSLFILSSYHKNLGRQMTLDLLNEMPQLFQQSQLANQLKATITDSSYPIIP